jgi:hypothetical protein
LQKETNIPTFELPKKQAERAGSGRARLPPNV